ncbi:MAG: hypothetical protein R3C03_06800 [Pirellulaceae bacterium]
MFSELQHFDLAGPVVPQIDSYVEQVNPLVVLWDNHDLSEVRTHSAAFEFPVGAGRVLVSTLNHDVNNSAGQWLLNKWLKRLATNAEMKFQGADGEQWMTRLQAEINRRGVDLSKRIWRFQADANHKGLELGWNETEFDDSKWSEIRTDSHWEGQGHSELDGWAWYRINVEVPDDWHSPTMFLNFTGVDDYADIYVNGELVRSVGDIENRVTAFEERVSIDVSRFLEQSNSLQLSIAVYDWFGAGGIFRPVTLSTEPLNEARPVLK